MKFSSLLSAKSYSHVTKFMAYGEYRDTVQINHGANDWWGDIQKVGDKVDFYDQYDQLKTGVIVSITSNAAFIKLSNLSLANKIPFSDITYNYRLSIRKTETAMAILDTVNTRLAIKKAKEVSLEQPLSNVLKGITSDMEVNNFELVQKSWADYWAKHPDHHKAAEALGAAAHTLGDHSGQGTMPTNEARQAHIDALHTATTVMGATKAKYLSDAAYKLGEKFGKEVNKYKEGTKKGKFMVEPHPHPYPHRPDIKTNEIPLHGQRLGHYNEKSDDALKFTKQDAQSAAEAMRGHNPQREGEYADQAFAAGDILRFRAKHGITKTESVKPVGVKKGWAEYWAKHKHGTAAALLTAATVATGAPIQNAHHEKDVSSIVAGEKAEGIAKHIRSALGSTLESHNVDGRSTTIHRDPSGNGKLHYVTHDSVKGTVSISSGNISTLKVEKI